MKTRLLTLVGLLSFFAIVACGPPQAPQDPSSHAGERDVDGDEARDPDAYLPTEGRVFGEARVIGNVAVYPITVPARLQADIGPLVGIDDALATDKAEVRERSVADVKKVLLENKGATPILLLAGTILVGGKQDRQVGQDTIIDPKTTVVVDAFCLEHGRWSAGSTGTKFHTADVIAPSKVRAAGQYEKNQSAVWSKVSESNAANGTSSASGTFLATVVDPTITSERTPIAARIEAALATVKPNADLVGFAYAINGEIRGVRWFAHHDVFAIVEKKLVNGIALEAVMSSREKGTVVAKAPAAAAVETFVKSVEAENVKEQRKTAGMNKNQYKESSHAYGSKAVIENKHSEGSVIPVSADYTAK
jgi:hypothetical protein